MSKDRQNAKTFKNFAELGRGAEDRKMVLAASVWRPAHRRLLETVSRTREQADMKMPVVREQMFPNVVAQICAVYLRMELYWEEDRKNVLKLINVLLTQRIHDYCVLFAYDYSRDIRDLPIAVKAEMIQGMVTVLSVDGLITHDMVLLHAKNLMFIGTMLCKDVIGNWFRYAEIAIDVLDEDGKVDGALPLRDTIAEEFAHLQCVPFGKDIASNFCLCEILAIQHLAESTWIAAGKEKPEMEFGLAVRRLCFTQQMQRLIGVDAVGIVSNNQPVIDKLTQDMFLRRRTGMMEGIGGRLPIDGTSPLDLHRLQQFREFVRLTSHQNPMDAETQELFDRVGREIDIAQQECFDAYVAQEKAANKMSEQLK